MYLHNPRPPLAFKDKRLIAAAKRFGSAYPGRTVQGSSGGTGD